MIPIGLIEVSGNSCRFVRSNPPYRKFIKRFFGFDLSFEGSSFVPYDDKFMINVVKTCCEKMCSEKGVPSFYDEQMSDGSVVHSFARRIGIDPVTGNMAVMIERDIRQYRELESLGWRILIVRKRELKKESIQRTLHKLEEDLLR